MNKLLDSLINFLPAGDQPTSAKRRKKQRARLKGYVMVSSGIALLATLVAVGVSEAASRIAPPDPSKQPASFRTASFANSFMDTMSTRLEPLPAAPPPVPAALPVSAPIDAPSANPTGQEVGKTAYVAKSHIDNVNVTFYDCKNQGFCGKMYNGRQVYQGAAACSWNLDIGTRFIIVGDPTKRIYTCEDRGLLKNTWVDIFWNDPRDGYLWQSKVGRYGTIEIVSVP